MTRDAVRDALVAVARDTLDHARAGSVRLADDVMRVDAATYTSEARFERERRLLFRRVPLLLAASCELPGPNSYLTMEVTGVPVLLTRDAAGQVHALVNICPHRGAVVADGCGRAARFVCPYHGWTFDARGGLFGVASARDFGAVDASAFGMRRLPVLEKAGLIWAVANPDSTLDIAAFLGGFGDMLGVFDFAGWHLLQRRVLPGANWKLAFDAHLEFYHLPVLHKNTFGPKSPNRALYHFYGPHQRLTQPMVREHREVPARGDPFAHAQAPEASWPDEALLFGEWIVFPHVSINSFYEGGRGVLISQVFPGERVNTSVTVQTYLTQDVPDDDARAAATKLCAMLEHVVSNEDLATSVRMQRALESGAMPQLCYGRNEGGLQHFHRWIDRILDTPDDGLNALFVAAAQGANAARAE